MLKELRRRGAAGFAAFAIVLANVILPAMPALADPANNGTLKVHEFGSPSNTESNQPKVCKFNFEGFGFDAGQSGVIKIEPQGGDSDTTDTLDVPFGPANENGYAQTEYINNGGALTLSDGHYKSTLYGKDTHDAYTIDLKAKSKVFKVRCDTSIPEPANPTVIAAAKTCTKINQLTGSATATITNVADETHDAAVYTWTVAGTTLTGTVTIDDGESTTVDLLGLGAGDYTITVDGNDFTSASTHFTVLECSQTITPCEVMTGPSVITTKSQFADTSDDRTAGHYVFTTDGLHIWTDDNTSNAKVAWYHNVNYPLSEVGVPTMDYTANSGIKPGLQLVIDFDGNGTSDGILVGEEVYGNDWWLPDSGAQFVKDGAPSHIGGSGSTNHGTLNQWLTNFPNAQVKAVGFSLGSGVHADGVLHSLTIGCHGYVFTTPPKAVTPVAPSVYDVCYDDEDYIQIQNTEGVIYKVNGIEYGAYDEIPFDGTTLVVTAEAEQGYILAKDAKTSWTFGAKDFTDEQCLTITKSAKVAKDTNLDGKIGIGDVVVWKITVTNNSTSEYESFTVDVDDENVFYLQHNGHIWHLGAGKSRTLIAKSVITEDDMRACKVTNTADFLGWRSRREVAKINQSEVSTYDEGHDWLAEGSATAEYILDCTPGKGGVTPETPKTPETPGIAVLPNTSGMSTQVIAISALSIIGLVLVAGTAIKSRLLV